MGITLDSMPTASATTVSKSLEYTSPAGSCSVAETTKGTYESFECSNRGACDGKSGLCMLRRLFRPIMPNTNSFGLNLHKKTSLNSKQKEMYFHIYNNKVDF